MMGFSWCFLELKRFRALKRQLRIINLQVCAGQEQGVILKLGFALQCGFLRTHAAIHGCAIASSYTYIFNMLTLQTYISPYTCVNARTEKEQK